MIIAYNVLFHANELHPSNASTTCSFNHLRRSLLVTSFKCGENYVIIAPQLQRKTLGCLNALSVSTKAALKGGQPDDLPTRFLCENVNQSKISARIFRVIYWFKLINGYQRLLYKKKYKIYEFIFYICRAHAHTYAHAHARVLLWKNTRKNFNLQK